MRADGIASFPVPVAGLIANLPAQNIQPQAILDGLNCFVDQDGYLKPRFGYSKLKDLVNSIGGSVTISAGATTANVTIPVVQPTATYPIVFGVRPSAGAPDVAVIFSARTTMGFTVTISADPGIGNTVEIDWYIPTGSDVFGIATFAAGVSTVGVVFATPLTASNYMVNFGVGVGVGSPSYVVATYDTPTVAGFNLNISAAPVGADTILVAWQIFFADLVPNTTHGNTSFTGATTQKTIVLASPQADTAYGVVLGVKRGTAGLDTAAVIALPTVNGFDIRIGAAPGAETVEVDWHVVRLEIATVGEPILGGISFYDATGTLQYVIATQHKWFKLDANLGWSDITDPANPNSGSLDDQVRFVTFPYLGDIWVLGVNNTNPMRAWKPGLTTYTTVSAAPICRDIEVIGSRVMAVNTVEAAVRYSYRVRWSNVNDFTTWQATSNQDLVDQGQPLVGIRRVRTSAAAIYGIEGITLATDQPGTDATAFRFDEVQQPTSPGPCGPSSLCSAVGLHYWLGLDARIYQFDGVSVVPISKQIDAILQQVVSLGFAGRFHTVYYQNLRQIWFYFVRGADEVPRWAIIYDVDSQTWSPLQELADFATTSFGALEAVGYTWLNWVSATVTWPTIPWVSWASIPDSFQPIMVLGTSLGNVERFGFNTTDDGVAIPWSFVSALQRLDPNSKQFPSAWDLFLKKQSSSEIVTSQLFSLAHPTATPVLLSAIAWDVSMDTPQGFYPGANAPVSGFAAKFPYNVNVPPAEDVYLQLVLQGSSTQRLAFFGGSEVFSYTERRA